MECQDDPRWRCPAPAHDCQVGGENGPASRSLAADAQGCIMVRVLGGSTAYKVVARQSPPMAGSPQIVLSKPPSVDSTALKGEQNRKMSLDKKSPIQGWVRG